MHLALSTAPHTTFDAVERTWTGLDRARVRHRPGPRYYSRNTAYLPRSVEPGRLAGSRTGQACSMWAWPSGTRSDAEVVTPAFGSSLSTARKWKSISSRRASSTP